MMTPNSLRLLSSTCVILLITLGAVAQSARKIARIETEGLSTLTTETVVATSALKIGETFSVEATDAAAERLVDSGLFKKVAYRTKTVGANVTITFQLEELQGQSSPVVFDNFIWFSDDELIAAIKSAVPSYDGSLPNSGNANETIKKALLDLLDARKLPGQVEYNFTEEAHSFRVVGVPMKICAIHFPGAQSVSEKKLAQVALSSTDPDYSREAALIFPKYVLYPIYSEVGQLRASFGAPIAKPATSSDCEGVDLTIPVNEGPIFSWTGAEWSGNQILPAKELDDALGMKPGEVANGKKFDEGLSAVRKAFGKFGYVGVSLKPTPEFDDAAQRVTYKIAVKEGPQYHFGTLDFKGFSADEAFQLNKRFALKSGDVYNQDYAYQFVREDPGGTLARIAQARASEGKPAPEIAVGEMAINKQLLVNVIIELRN